MTRHPAIPVVLLCSLAAPLSAQDWWARVPAFPKTCYSAEDPFHARLDTVRNELQQAFYRQDSINAALREKIETMDAGERQSRMIAFLQKDPVAGQKYMRDVASAQNAGESAQALADKRDALRGKLAQADTAWAEAMKPLTPIIEEYRRESDPSGNMAKARVAAARYNAAYEKLCASWFGESSSPFLEYLADFKRYVEEDVPPIRLESTRVKTQPFTIFGVPSDGFRTTEDLKAIHEYMGEVAAVFSKRRAVALETR